MTAWLDDGDVRNQERNGDTLNTYAEFLTRKRAAHGDAGFAAAIGCGGLYDCRTRTEPEAIPF